MSDPDETWFTVQETADIFRCSVKTIRSWIANGTLEGLRFGPTLIRVSSSSIKALGNPVLPSHVAGGEDIAVKN